MIAPDEDKLDGIWSVRLYFESGTEDRINLGTADILRLLRNPALRRLRLASIVDLRRPLAEILESDRRTSDQIEALARMANRGITNHYLDLDRDSLALVVELS